MTPPLASRSPPLDQEREDKKIYLETNSRFTDIGVFKNFEYKSFAIFLKHPKSQKQ